MVGKALGVAVVASVLFSANAFAQAPAAPPPGGQAPAPGGAGRGGTGQTVGTQGDPDPGVHFIEIIDNPSVRVLQVTLQPGAVRRQHLHNDITFDLLIPVTGGLELTADGLGTISAVPGQAYYVLKGQPHGFTNKGGAPVQVIEVFVKPGPPPAPWDPSALPPAAPATPPAAAPPAAVPPAGVPPAAAPAGRGTPPPAR